jgi:hypothetical protein
MYFYLDTFVQQDLNLEISKIQEMENLKEKNIRNRFSGNEEVRTLSLCTSQFHSAAARANINSIG